MPCRRRVSPARARTPASRFVKDLEGVDAAVFGMPWDGGTSFRSGARFGPEAIRSASGMIRTYNAVQRVQVFGELSTIDYGDARPRPDYIEDTLARIESFVRPLAESDAVPIGMGGDHSVTLAELRALAAVHGPLGLVHLDSHTDLWDAYNGHPYAHGTMFRRALEEGIVDRCAHAAGGHARAALRRRRRGDPGRARRGDDPWIELEAMSAAELADRVRARLGEQPAFLSLDVDFVDPRLLSRDRARPRSAGRPASRRSATSALCVGLPFVGFDVVEVSPPYDGPGQVTALFAANVDLRDALAGDAESPSRRSARRSPDELKRPPGRGRSSTRPRSKPAGSSRS